jgi:hypothetical protein
MSRSFIVPMFCFAFIAFYAFMWPTYSNAESMQFAGGSGIRRGDGTSPPDTVSK